MTKEQNKLNFALLNASRDGNLEKVKYLIAKGAKITAGNKHDKIPLYLAAMNGHLAVVKYLIEETGADVAERVQHGMTVLHWASAYGQLDVVKYLIEEIALDVDVMDNMLRSPLYLATFNGKFEVSRYLFLERNALMSISGLFYDPELIKEKQGRETEAQSILDYFLQYKSKYKPKEIQEFKTEFLRLQMNEEDSMNLKAIVKFL